MNELRPIPREVLANQVRASNPRTSVWVAANAGSGKTHVLAQRVIRLLLDGCEPSRILCLTFTKAAAATMAKRVFDTLAKWTTLDDAKLSAALTRIGVTGVDAGVRAHARRLFAAALETPGGLKVQTIHAFCARLLHQFPFEANVAARFTVLEERAEAELIDKLRVEVLLQAAAEPAGALGRALAAAIVTAADQTFAAVLREAIAARDRVMAWLEHAGGTEAAAADLSRALRIGPAETQESIEAEFLRGLAIPVAEWPAVMAVMAAGSDSDRQQERRLAAAHAATGWARIEAYADIFCTEKLKPRKHIVTKAVAAGNPGLAERLLAEQERVCAFLALRHAVLTRDRTAALLTIAGEVIRRYRDEKERRGLLDYDDLIDKTLAMLATVNPSWVHYKLDLGIDHLLIDEAQDTSLKQWEVICRLVAEFTAGAGARGTIERSIFAVGDEKQSIFSFQGAAPRYFAEMRRRFEANHRDGGFGFVALDFKYSFRSAPVVLEAVDTVFGRPQAYAGLTADPVKTVHQAVRDRAPGLVEVWPLVEPDDRREIEAWDAPFDTPSETAPVVKLARRIAARLKEWVGGEWVADTDTGQSRLMRPGDVLVLVRQRGPLFEAVIRALKNAGIAVAGADRLLLTEHIAVMDLMVLADALLLPSDDLALATVLKSPLLGLTDDDLFVLAWNRSGTLRRALDQQARANSRFAAAAATLDRWAEVARREPPFAFYARVLGPDRGRARMLARLGPEAADALDEFLALALDYESRETPSLQGFVAWLRASTTEVKRDMEIGRDEVRVMTVHGAKGLEAPVVILADTTTNPSGPYPPRLLTVSSPGAPDRIVWAGAKNTDVALVAAARAHALQAAADEYRRLLYVAMTRAADRLIVCGAEGLRRRPDGCWYDLVRDALEPVAAKVAGPEGEILQLRQGMDLGNPAQLALALPPAPTDCPGWLTRDAPAVAMPAMVSPSTAILEAPMPASGAPDERGRALVRGTLIHRLMQSLPDIASERRDAAARRYLERADSDFTEVERQALVEQVRAVLDEPRFALLAGPGSRAEVPIVGRIVHNGRELVVSGQIDRLAITEKEILIADYKSNRPAPRQIEQVPESYLGQLALYRALLAKLYPGRPVRAALIWTDVPDFMDISSDALGAALARITSA